MDRSLKTRCRLNKCGITEFNLSTPHGDFSVNKVYLEQYPTHRLTKYDIINNPITPRAVNADRLYIAGDIKYAFRGDLVNRYLSNSYAKLEYFLPNTDYFFYLQHNKKVAYVLSSNNELGTISFDKLNFKCGKKFVDKEDWNDVLSVIPCRPCMAYNNDNRDICYFNVPINTALPGYFRNHYKLQPILGLGMCEVKEVVNSSYAFTVTDTDGNVKELSQVYIVDQNGLSRLLTTDSISKTCEVIYSDVYKTIIYDRTYWRLSRDIKKPTTSVSNKLEEPLYKVLECKETPELVKGTHLLVNYGDYILAGNVGLGYKVIPKDKFEQRGNTVNMLTTRTYLGNLYKFDPETEVYTFSNIHATICKAAENLVDLFGITKDKDAQLLAESLFDYGKLTEYRDWNIMDKSWILSEISDMIYFMTSGNDYVNSNKIKVINKIIKATCAFDVYNYIRRHLNLKGYTGSSITKLVYSDKDMHFKAILSDGTFLS